MATYTSNYNLYKPDSSDAFGDFRNEFNNNMDIIDQNLGGGGGNANIVELTQAEYDALPDTKLTDGKVYFIKDAISPEQFLTVKNGAICVIFDDGT